MERVDVHAVTEARHHAGHQLACLFEQILLPGDQGLFAHPYDHRLKLMIDLRHVARPDEHVAAARVDLILERERDRL